MVLERLCHWEVIWVDTDHVVWRSVAGRNSQRNTEVRASLFLEHAHERLRELKNARMVNGRRKAGP